MKVLMHSKTDDFLVHDLVRLMRLADVVVGADNLSSHDLFKKSRTLEDSVRIISNGKESVVMRA